MSNEGLLRFCAANDVLRIEREPNGDLTIMSPSGAGTGNANAFLIYQLVKWAEQDGRGTAFDSNTGFQLPDGSMRSPDAAWMSWGRWNALTREQTRGFAPVCPEFVIELRSPSDSLPELRNKMGSWIDNGAELAWLIDPQSRTVAVYRRSGSEPDIHEGPTAVYGDGPVGGFALEMARLWG